jgi:hypothetical protein
MLPAKLQQCTVSAARGSVSAPFSVLRQTLKEAEVNKKIEMKERPHNYTAFEHKYNQPSRSQDSVSIHTFQQPHKKTLPMLLNM